MGGFGVYFLKQKLRSIFESRLRGKERSDPLQTERCTAMHCAAPRCTAPRTRPATLKSRLHPPHSRCLTARLAFQGREAWAWGRRMEQRTHFTFHERRGAPATQPAPDRMRCCDAHATSSEPRVSHRPPPPGVWSLESGVWSEIQRQPPGLCSPGIVCHTLQLGAVQTPAQPGAAVTHLLHRPEHRHNNPGSNACHSLFYFISSSSCPN